MAEASISVHQDNFSYPVCLLLLKDPVSTPCGHNICKVCINSCWDQDDLKGVYSCPKCRMSFTPRPALCSNNIVVEVVQKLKHQSDPNTAPGEVECDFCTEGRCEAVKSCLMCLVSLCETHVKPHLDIPALKKHKLVKASTQLQEKTCSQHDRLVEVYCRTDQICICYLCTMHEHKDHDTVATVTERMEKQGQLKKTQEEVQQRMQDKQKEHQGIENAVKTLKLSAEAAVEECERIFTELIQSIEKKCSEVTELITAQEKAELSHAEELLKKLEQEIADLKRRDTELKQLSHKEDHYQFLQSFQSLCFSSGCGDSSRITVNQHPSFAEVNKSLSDLKTQVEQFCMEEFSNITAHVQTAQVILPPPKVVYAVHSEELEVQDQAVFPSNKSYSSYSSHDLFS